MKLWHDDIRKPPSDDWTWARTNPEAVELLLTGEVEVCSLDHDLGFEDVDPDAPGAHMLRGSGPQTGYDLVRWMVSEEGVVPDTVVLHSWSPVGAERMRALLADHGHDATVAPYSRRNYA